MRQFLLCLVFAGVVTASKAEIIVENPSRAFGYVIGDVLTQRIQLNANDDDKPLLEPELESQQRVDPYLYRLSSTTVEHANTQWLEIQYQIINAPLHTQTIELPVVQLYSSSGDSVESQAWPLSVGPLLPSSEEGTPKLLPDRSAQSTLKAPDTTLLKASIAALLLSLLCWLSWWLWRNQRDTKRLPFAHAVFSIRKLPAPNRDEQQQTWAALHHAFNRTAGKAISGSSIDALLHIAPWLQPLDSDIRDFYAASAERFYQNPAVLRAVPVAKLCQRLAKLERDHSGSAASAESPPTHRTASSAVSDATTGSAVSTHV